MNTTSSRKLVVDAGNGTVRVQRQASMKSCERLGAQIEREGFETVGGFLLGHVGRVPQSGETFDVDGLRVEVMDAERRRITKSASLAPSTNQSTSRS